MIFILNWIIHEKSRSRWVQGNDSSRRRRQLSKKSHRVILMEFWGFRTKLLHRFIIYWASEMLKWSHFLAQKLHGYEHWWWNFAQNRVNNSKKPAWNVGVILIATTVMNRHVTSTKILYPARHVTARCFFIPFITRCHQIAAGGVTSQPTFHPSMGLLHRSQFNGHSWWHFINLDAVDLPTTN